MLNWDLYQGCFSSASMQQVWSQDAAITSWIKVEQSLASVQAQHQLIPAQVAVALANITVDDIDMAQMQTQMQLVGRPIVNLVQQLKSLVPPTCQKYVHYLSTTQDIMDTANSLRMREGVSIIQQQIETILADLKRLCESSNGQLMLARTNGQYAVVTQLSTKFELWIAELSRRQGVLKEVSERTILLQLGGPVGDLSNYPPNLGTLVKQGVAKDLGLATVEPHWQNTRDSLYDMLSSLGSLCATVCKIAHNVNLLASSDIDEMKEGYTPGKGASSSMSHKKNQRATEFCEATARLGRQRAEQMGELCAQQHERSGGMMIGEFVLVPEVFLLTSGSLMWMEQLFAGLEINKAVLNHRVESFNAATSD